jgi:hypothetical protein
MQEVFLIGAAAVIVAAAAGWIVGRWAPRAKWLSAGAAIGARLLGAAAAAWAVVLIVRHYFDLLGLAFAVVMSIIGAWMAVIGAGMLYLALFCRRGIEDNSGGP